MRLFCLNFHGDCRSCASSPNVHKKFRETFTTNPARFVKCVLRQSLVEQVKWHKHFCPPFLLRLSVNICARFMSRSRAVLNFDDHVLILTTSRKNCFVKRHQFLPRKETGGDCWGEFTLTLHYWAWAVPGRLHDVRHGFRRSLLPILFRLMHPKTFSWGTRGSHPQAIT